MSVGGLNEVVTGRKDPTRDKPSQSTGDTAAMSLHWTEALGSCLSTAPSNPRHR